MKMKTIHYSELLAEYIENDGVLKNVPTEYVSQMSEILTMIVNGRPDPKYANTRTHMQLFSPK